MSSVPSSSQLSRPSTSKSVAISDVSITEKKDDSDDRKGYSANSIAKDPRVTEFLNDTIFSGRKTWRHLSHTVKALPFLSTLIDSPETLASALKPLCPPNSKPDLQFGFKCLMTTGVNFGGYERRSLGKEIDIRQRRTFSRKMRLVAWDEGVHEPGDLVEQAKYFGKLHNTSTAGWISPLAMLIAFDTLAAHILPGTRTRSMDSSAPYRNKPVDPAAVAGYELVLGDLEKGLTSWIDYATTPTGPLVDTAGVLDMLQHGARQSVGGIAMCNISITVLTLKHLFSANPGDHELVVETMDADIRAKILKQDKTLHKILFPSSAKIQNSIVAFLCFAMLSPLCLLTGHALYGGNPALAAHMPFMIWPQLAHLEKPQWLVQMEFELRDLVLSLVFNDKVFNAGSWKLFVALAERWKTTMAKKPLDPKDALFYHERVSAWPSPAQKKKKRKSVKAADDTVTLGTADNADHSAGGQQAAVETGSDKPIPVSVQAAEKTAASSEPVPPSAVPAPSPTSAAEPDWLSKLQVNLQRLQVNSGGSATSRDEDLAVAGSDEDMGSLGDDEEEPQSSVGRSRTRTPSNSRAPSPRPALTPSQRFFLNSNKDLRADVNFETPDVTMPVERPNLSLQNGPNAEERDKPRHDDRPCSTPTSPAPTVDNSQQTNDGDLMEFTQDPVSTPTSAPQTFDDFQQTTNDDSMEVAHDLLQNPSPSSTEIAPMTVPPSTSTTSLEELFPRRWARRLPSTRPSSPGPQHSSSSPLTPLAEERPTFPPAIEMDITTSPQGQDASTTELPAESSLASKKRKRRKGSDNSAESGRDSEQGEDGESTGGLQNESQPPPNKKTGGRKKLKTTEDAESSAAPSSPPPTAATNKGEGQARPPSPERPTSQDPAREKPADDAESSVAPSTPPPAVDTNKGEEQARPSSPERPTSTPPARESTIPPRRQSRQPSVSVKIEEPIVLRSLTEARTRIKKKWKMKDFSTVKIDSDMEELVENRPNGGDSKDTLQKRWGRSFVARALGGFRNNLRQKPQRQTDAQGSENGISLSNVAQEAMDVDAPISQPNLSIPNRAGPSRREQFGGDTRMEAVDEGSGSDEDRGSSLDADGETDPEAGTDGEETSDKEKSDKETNDERLSDEKSDDGNPSDSDREYKDEDDTDVEVSAPPDDGMPLSAPFKVATYADDDLSPVLLYDVRIAMPTTGFWRARKLLKTVDASFRAMDVPGDIDWIETYTPEQWQKRTFEEIETTMNLNHVVIVRGTPLPEDWQWTVHYGSKIRSGTNPVEVQSFSDKNQGTGVDNIKVPLTHVIDPNHRDPNKVYNLLNAPQQTPIVQVPRAGDLDYSSKAVKTRFEAHLEDLTQAESQREFDLQRGLNWGIISQAHSVTLGHVDTAGVYTAVIILTGEKYWAVRKTTLADRTELDCDNIDYWVKLGDRDLTSASGDKTSDWVPILLRPGDMLIIPPNARHAVWTLTDCMMAGIHFYFYTQLQRSLCGWILTKFSTTQISNTEHDIFLSIIQSHSTFYVGTFSKTKRALLADDDPAVRTQPHPSRSLHGLSVLVALAVSLVFNDSLSGVAKPYRGLYYLGDRFAFHKIWLYVTKDGYIRATNLNFDVRVYVSILRAEMIKGDVWDDRWTCAGLGVVLVHVARALVALAWTWEEKRERLSEGAEFVYNEAKEWVKPGRMYVRVVQDISSALGVDEKVAKSLVGTYKECTKIVDGSIFPTTEWVKESPRQSTRPPSLWDAFYQPETSVEDPETSLPTIEEDVERSDDDGEYGKKPKKGKKVAGGRKVKVSNT